MTNHPTDFGPGSDFGVLWNGGRADFRDDRRTVKELMRAAGRRSGRAQRWLKDARELNGALLATRLNSIGRDLELARAEVAEAGRRAALANLGA